MLSSRMGEWNSIGGLVVMTLIQIARDWGYIPRWGTNILTHCAKMNLIL